MKALAITSKTLKETFRQPKNLGIMLGLPVAFMVIFGLAFGDADEETYSIAVVDHDDSELSRAYVEGLAGLAYASGTPIFELVAADEAAAREGVAASRHAAALVIPAGFMEDALPSGEPPEGPVPPLTQPQTGPTPARGANVSTVGDPARVSFQVASQTIAAYTAAFAESVGGGRPPVAASVEPITAAELTQFDFIAPGLMVFAILNIVPQAAGTLAREVEQKTVDRVRMSPTGALPLLVGVALAQVALAFASLALMLLTARLMGFHNQGTYAGAYLIAIGAAVAVTGIGLLIAAFARTQQEATNLGIGFAVPASLLSGAFFPVPAVALFGGVELYDVLPTKHAVAAMREVMTYGSGLDAVTASLGALAALGALYFAAGVVLYRRTRLRVS